MPSTLIHRRSPVSRPVPHEAVPHGMLYEQLPNAPIAGSPPMKKPSGVPARLSDCVEFWRCIHVNLSCAPVPWNTPSPSDCSTNPALDVSSVTIQQAWKPTAVEPGSPRPPRGKNAVALLDTVG